MTDVEFYKYLAGLVDADGNLYFDYRKSTSNKMYSICKISIAQKKSSLLFFIKDKLNDIGSFYYNKVGGAWIYQLIGKDSFKLLENIGTFFVLKKDQAEYVLKNKKNILPFNKEKIQNDRKEMSGLRFSHNMPTQFSYAWFSGFFDGDGYIGAQMGKNSKKPKIVMAISFDKKENFFGNYLIAHLGGQVRKMRNGVMQWYLNVNSENLHILESMVKFSFNKRHEIEEVIGWIRKYPTHKKNIVSKDESTKFCGTLKTLKVKDIDLNSYILSDMRNYQIWTRMTASYPKETALLYLGLGLAGESGEVCEKVKKLIRGDYELDDKFKLSLKYELGDVLYYIARIADEVGISLTDIAVSNQDKLEDRTSRGVIQGSGDNR